MRMIGVGPNGRMELTVGSSRNKEAQPEFKSSFPTQRDSLGPFELSTFGIQQNVQHLHILAAPVLIPSSFQKRQIAVAAQITCSITLV